MTQLALHWYLLLCDNQPLITLKLYVPELFDRKAYCFLLILSTVDITSNRCGSVD